MSFLLFGIWPGVDTGDIDGSDDLCPNRGGCIGGRGGGAAEDPIELTYLSPCLQVAHDWELFPRPSPRKSPLPSSLD